MKGGATQTSSRSGVVLESVPGGLLCRKKR